MLLPQVGERMPDFGALLEKGISTLDEVVWGVEDTRPPVDYIVPKPSSRLHSRARLNSRSKSNSSAPNSIAASSREYGHGYHHSHSQSQSHSHSHSQSNSHHSRLQDQHGKLRSENNGSENNDNYSDASSATTKTATTHTTLSGSMGSTRRRASDNHNSNHKRKEHNRNQKERKQKELDEIFGYNTRQTVTRFKNTNGSRRLDAGLDFYVLDASTPDPSSSVSTPTPTSTPTSTSTSTSMLIVRTIRPESIFANSDLGVGDAVLAINGISFRHQTHGHEHEHEQDAGSHAHATSSFRPSVYKAKKALLASNSNRVTIDYQKFGESNTSQCSNSEWSSSSVGSTASRSSADANDNDSDNDDDDDGHGVSHNDNGHHDEDDVRHHRPECEFECVVLKHSRSDQTSATRSFSTHVSCVNREGGQGRTSEATATTKPMQQQQQQPERHQDPPPAAKSGVVVPKVVPLPEATVTATPPPKTISKLQRLRARTKQLRASGQKKIEASRKRLSSLTSIVGSGNSNGNGNGNRAAKKEKDKDTTRAKNSSNDGNSNRNSITPDDNGQHKPTATKTSPSTNGACLGSTGCGVPAIISPDNSLHDGKSNHDDAWNERSLSRGSSFLEQGSEDDYDDDDAASHHYAEQIELLKHRLLYQSVQGSNHKSGDDHVGDGAAHNDVDDDDCKHMNYCLARSHQESAISSTLTPTRSRGRGRRKMGATSSTTPMPTPTTSTRTGEGNNHHHYVTASSILDDISLCSTTIEQQQYGSILVQQPTAGARGTNSGTSAVTEEQYQELTRINRKVFDKLQERVKHLKCSNIQLGHELAKLRSSKTSNNNNSEESTAMPAAATANSTCGSANDPEKLARMESRLQQANAREGIYKSQLELLQSRLEISTIQADKRQRELTASKEQLVTENKAVIERLTKRIAELECSNQMLALERCERAAGSSTNPGDSDLEQDPKLKRAMLEELPLLKARNRFLEQRVVSLEAQLKVITSQQDQGGEGVELPYEDTSYYKQQQRQRHLGRPVGHITSVASISDDDPTIRSAINNNITSNIAAKQDLSSSCWMDIPSDEDKDSHGYDTIDISGDSNGLDLNSSNEEILSGSIGIDRKPGSIVQRTARGTALRFVCEHTFDKKAAAANDDTAANDDSFWAEGNTVRDDDDNNNNSANTSGVDDSFESVSSMVLIERILDLEGVLQKKDMTESERDGFVRALQCRIKKLTERGYERDD